MSAIQADIEARLADVEPEVEVLLAEGLGVAGRVRAWWALPPVIGRRGPYTG